MMKLLPNTTKKEAVEHTQKTIRVIIVDDQQHIRQGLCALLATAKNPSIEIVAEAADGKTAVNAVTIEQPDLVLMDIQMPKMDGIEAARTIKAQFPNIKIILLTVSAAYEEAALAAGADLFLVKGRSPEHLLSAVSHLFDQDFVSNL